VGSRDGDGRRNDEPADVGNVAVLRVWVAANGGRRPRLTTAEGHWFDPSHAHRDP